MSIKGLTDRYATALDTSPRGRPIRLGRLQKGRREGFGRKIKLFDEDHLVFVPYDNDRALTDLFIQAYGREPKEIPDVRIPVSLAGNFDIGECAWLIAAKHTEKGSVFMARSDGESVLSARNPATGKVEHYAPGELAYSAVTNGADGGDHYLYGDKAYPWSQVMTVDLILPDFNRLVYAAGVAGAGVISLRTSSTYDIANLTAEYHAILEELVSLFANPLRSGDIADVRRYLPLRNIPLRLYRSEDPVTTPNWRKDGDPGERLHSTRSLLHWQLAPEFAAAMQVALDQRTQQTLVAAASVPLIGRREPIDDINRDLFGDDPGGAPQLPPPRRIEPAPEPALTIDWEELTAELGQPAPAESDAEAASDSAEPVPATEADGSDAAAPASDPDTQDEEAEEEPASDEEIEALVLAEDAQTAEAWAQAAWELPHVDEYVKGTDGLLKWREAVAGDFNPAHNAACIDTLAFYVESLADGATKKQAVAAAGKFLKGLLLTPIDKAAGKD